MKYIKFCKRRRPLETDQKAAIVFLSSTVKMEGIFSEGKTLYNYIINEILVRTVSWLVFTWPYLQNQWIVRIGEDCLLAWEDGQVQRREVVGKSPFLLVSSRCHPKGEIKLYAASDWSMNSFLKLAVRLLHFRLVTILGYGENLEFFHGFTNWRMVLWCCNWHNVTYTLLLKLGWGESLFTDILQ